MENKLKIFLEFSGSGHGYGSGYGYGDGSDVLFFGEDRVYTIDGVSTIIKSIKGNVAKGFMLNNDLTVMPCYIARVDGCFAHASTMKEAVSEARKKAIYY